MVTEFCGHNKLWKFTDKNCVLAFVVSLLRYYK